MADNFSTTPHNFDKIEENVSPTKYLDLAGLIQFFDKLKEYISVSDKSLNGSNIKMYAGVASEDNPTISSQIENLWAAFGEGDLGDGGLAGNISTILGQYVKDIKHATSQNLPLKVKVEEGNPNTNQKDIYTISLEDNGLEENLEDLTNNRVSSITPSNTGGDVTLTVDKNRGDVTLIINSSSLTEAVKSLQSGKISSVSKGTGSETYVELGVSTSNNAVTITINDSALVDELDDIKGQYALKTEIPSKLPTPYSIKLKDTGNTEHVFDGSAEVDLTAGVNYATNAGKLGGQGPSYYATQGDLDDTNDRVGHIESNYTKTVDVGTNGLYTQLTVTPTKGDVKISVNDSAVGDIDDRLGDVESSYIKTFGGKKGEITINTGSTTPWDVNFQMTNNKLVANVVPDPGLIGDIAVSSSLNDVVTITESESNGVSTITIGGTLNTELADIKDDVKNRVQDINVENGNIGTKYVTISVTDDTNASSSGKQSKITINDSALTEAIGDIRSIISGLGKVVEIKGITSTLPTTTDGYGDGDVLIVGDKEYICFESKWYLFGYTSELAEDFNAHTHTYTPTGTVASTFTGTQATIATGAASATVEVSKLKTAGAIPTYSGVSVPNADHTHNVTHKPAGTVASTFTGTQATITTGATSATVEVSKLKTAGAIPTYSGVSVPNTDHTHNVTHKPAGTVASTFTGTQATITTGATSATVEVSKLKTAGELPTYSGVSVPNTDHTHNVTHKPAGTVASTFTGTQATITTGATSATVEVSKLKTAGAIPTYSGVSVPNADHTHNVTHKPAGTVASTFAGTQATINTGAASATVEVSKLKTAGAIPTYSGVSVPNADHTHNVTHKPAGTVASTFAGTQATITTGAASDTVEVSKLKTTGAVPTYSSVSVPNTEHTHTVTHTPAGTVASAFTGTQATITTGAASDTVEVSKLKTAGELPTYSGVSVPDLAHTHDVSANVDGSVDSIFAGTQATITTGAPSATTTVATKPSVTYQQGTLTITFGTTTVASNTHTHSASYKPTGSVTSTFTGTVQVKSTKPDTTNVVTINSITSAGSMPTFDVVDVPSSGHTHSASYKPAGSVTSTFTGTSAKLTSTKPDTTNVETINSITSAGSMPTFDVMDVPSSTHTHSASYKPTGSVTSTFTGTSATLTSTKPDTTNVETINSITSAGSMPAFDVVDVPSSTHTHSASYKPAGSVTSTFTGTSATLTSTKPDTTNVSTVNSITSAGSMPAFDVVDVPSSTHTHSASYKPTGSVTSTFTGTSATLTSTKPDTTNVSTVNSITSAGSMPAFDVVDVPSSTHTHSASYKPAGSVTSTFTGTSATLTSTKPDTTNVSTVNSITSAGSMPAFDVVDVPSGTHTHSASYKPAGSVTSTFTGTSATLTSTKPDTTNVSTVNSITSAGSMPAFDVVDVPSGTHTHSASYKPAGSVTSTFTGTSATLTSTKPDTTNVSTVNSITSAGSMPAFDVVDVPSGTHTHSASYKPAGSVTSTFTGTLGETSIPTETHDIPDDVIE